MENNCKNTFVELNNEETELVEGGIGLVASLLIGACCLLGGTGLGLGTAYVVAKM